MTIPKGGLPPKALTEREVVQAEEQAARVHRAACAQIRILDARRRVAETRAATAHAEGQTLVQLIRNQDLSRQLAGGKREEPPRCESKSTPGAATPFHWEITDETVESLALRVVLEFRRLPETEVERAWGAWKRELGARFPPYAAAEIERRAAELWQLSG